MSVEGYKSDETFKEARARFLNEKPTNPKDLIGTDKVPLSLVPATALAYQALAHLEGNLKYGLVNWREAGVRTMIYMDAMLRHAEKFINGEWADPDSRVPHLASICACANIIMDARECGKLVDDRPKSAPAARVIDEAADIVRHLRELHKDKNPRHYTIADNDRVEADHPTDKYVVGAELAAALNRAASERTYK